MMPRIRPFFHENYLRAATGFDPEMPVESLQARITSKLMTWYPRARGFFFLNEGRRSLGVILKILSVQPGDEILVPCFTCSSVLEPISSEGVQPVLVDVHKDYTMDASQVEKRITGRTRAVIVTHYWGIPSNIMEIREIVEGKGIAVIEDCAHVLCSHPGGLKLGSIGDFAFTSHKIDKSLALGRGSCLVVNRGDLLPWARGLVQGLEKNTLHDERCAFLSLLSYYIMTEPATYRGGIGIYDYYHHFLSHPSQVEKMFTRLKGGSGGENPSLQEIQVPDIRPSLQGRITQGISRFLGRGGRETHESHGLPLRMNAFSLGILDTALDYIMEINRKRRENGRLFRKYLPESPALTVPRPGDFDFLRFPVLGATDQISRELIRDLMAAGYEVGNFNWPFTLNRLIPGGGDFPSSEFIARNIINLPSHPSVAEEDIISLSQVVRRVM